MRSQDIWISYNAWAICPAQAFDYLQDFHQLAPFIFIEMELVIYVQQRIGIMIQYLGQYLYQGQVVYSSLQWSCFRIWVSYRKMRSQWSWFSFAFYSCFVQEGPGLILEVWERCLLHLSSQRWSCFLQLQRIGLALLNIIFGLAIGEGLRS